MPVSLIRDSPTWASPGAPGLPIPVIRKGLACYNAGMNEDDGLLSRLTDRTRKVVRLSAAFSHEAGHQEIEPQDILDALAHMGGISDVVLAETGYLKKQAPKAISDADRMIGASESLRVVITEAHEQARLLGHHYVGTEHLLLALAHTNPQLLPDPNAVRPCVLEILGHDPQT